MRWSFLLAVIGLSVSSVASFAERPPGDQRLAPSRSASQSDGFFATTGMVRFQMIQGRLCLDVSCHRKGSQQRESDGQFESLTVTAERGIPSLHYVFNSDQQRLMASVQQANAIRFESWLLDVNERAVLTQPAAGLLSFSIERGDLHDRYEGATLIHIRHADRDGFDRHYGSLVAQILQGRSLQEICDQTEQIMLTRIGLNDAATSAVPTLPDVREQVNRLRSDNRTQRIAAEQQLLCWGTPILATLQTINQDDLDTEQRVKLQSITKRLRPRVGDTPNSLARLLHSDRSYWSAIASRLDRDQIQLASEHLQQLGVRAIEFDTGPSERIAAANE